jgi:alkylation response protein AidB-like acyl-CoA dehydrogenase
MVGGARRVLDMTVAHVTQRQQFGVALGTFQAVQHACADLAISLDSARLATWEGLSLADQGQRCRAAGAVAGWLAGRAYIAAAETGAQLHGGLGAIRDYPLHFYYRRAQAMAARLGSEAAQLEELAHCLVDPVEAGQATPWVA